MLVISEGKFNVKECVDNLLKIMLAYVCLPGGEVSAKIILIVGEGFPSQRVSRLKLHIVNHSCVVQLHEQNCSFT